VDYSSSISYSLDNSITVLSNKQPIYMRYDDQLTGQQDDL